METKELVFEALKNSDKPLKAAEIADQTGIDKKEVSKVIKVLVKEEKAFSPKVCFYTIK
jgi:DNA-binding transcriptional regulator GbsR (MarR family)